MPRLFKAVTPAKPPSPSPFLPNRKRTSRRPFLTREVSFAIKPTDDKDSEQAEIVNEEDLPEYVPDPLLNMGPPDEDVDVKKLDPERRTTKIIVDLVNAGNALSTDDRKTQHLFLGSLFEDKLEEYRDYLDENLLEKFWRRIECAERYEDASASEGLRMIWRRVRAEVERQNATPSLRLLDELLGILHPAAGGTSKDRKRNALGRMYEAFTQSQSGAIDIIGLAQVLADGKDPPPGLLRELVQKKDFVREVEEVLDGAEASEGELKERRSLLLQQRSAMDTDRREFRELSKELEALDRFMDDRRQSLRDVQTLLDMAKAI